MARRIPCVGMVTVSLLKSTKRLAGGVEVGCRFEAFDMSRKYDSRKLPRRLGYLGHENLDCERRGLRCGLTASMNVLQAKEGMWIPPLLNLVEGDMQAMGLKLTAEDIYSINNSSLKDAVVHFNGGCTAEMVSAEGLLLTNHHCGYGQIQQHSTVDNDLLTNGFWAMSRDEELPNPLV